MSCDIWPSTPSAAAQAHRAASRVMQTATFRPICLGFFEKKKKKKAGQFLILGCLAIRLPPQQQPHSRAGTHRQRLWRLHPPWALQLGLGPRRKIPLWRQPPQLQRPLGSAAPGGMRARLLPRTWARGVQGVGVSVMCSRRTWARNGYGMRVVC